MTTRRWEWGGLSLALILALWGATGLAQDIRVIYAGNPEGSVWLGVQLGEQEANILGRFTGHTYRVEPSQHSGRGTASESNVFVG